MVPQSVRYHKMPPPRVLSVCYQARLHGVLGRTSIYETFLLQSYSTSPPAVGDLKGATFEPGIYVSARISKPRIRHAPFSRHNTRCGPSQEFLSLKLKMGGGGGETGTGSNKRIHVLKPWKMHKRLRSWSR
jgi:hypothetical protein